MLLRSLWFFSAMRTRRVTVRISRNSAVLAASWGRGSLGRGRRCTSALVTALAALATTSCASGKHHDLAETSGDGGSRSDAGFVTEDAGLGWTAPPADAGPTYAPTFYAVYYEILRPTCGIPFCHLTPGYFTVATPELAYQTLVNAPATSDACRSTGLMRVAPGQPDQSLLYLKITNPPCGKQMPLSFGTSTPLDPRKIEQIREWILRGAPEVETGIGLDASADAAPEGASANRDASAAGG